MISLYFGLALVALCGFYFAGQLLRRVIDRRRVSKLFGCQPPSYLDHVDKLFGSDIFFHSYDGLKKQRYLALCQERFRRQGSTYIGNMLGSNVINTCDPENVKAILATQFDEYDLGSRRQNAFKPLLGHGIFAADGDHWKNARRLLRPSFSRDQIANFTLLTRHARELIDVIDARQSEQGSVDLQPLFFRLTLDTATELFFGESCNSLRSAKAQGHDGSEFAAAFDRSQRVLADNFVLGSLAKLPFVHPEFKRDRATIYKFIDRYVERAINLAQNPAEKCKTDEKADTYVVLEEMALHTSDAQQLRSDILNLMVAGRDTTASLLSNLWFELAGNQRVWEALRAEVMELQGSSPDYVKLKEMKYLQACLRESLRLHPPVPLNSRTANCNTIIPKGGGEDGESPVVVPRGTVVSFSAYAMHRREDIWGEDAAEFRPERWDGRRTHWEFLPFNGGPRICLGQQLALTEAAFITTLLVQNFPNIESLNEGPWRESLTLTVCSKDGTKVRLRRGEGTFNPHDFQRLPKPADAPSSDNVPIEGPPLEGPPIETIPVKTPPLDTHLLKTSPLDTQTLDTPPLDIKPTEPKPLDTKSLDVHLLDTQPFTTPPLHTASFNTPPLNIRPLDAPRGGFTPAQTVVA